MQNTAEKQLTMNWATQTLIPFLDKSKQELDRDVDYFVFLTTIRRMAVKGTRTTDDLVEALLEHFTHQQQHGSVALQH
jgi:hypothetical protein